MSTFGLDVSKWQATTPPLEGFDFLIARASIGLTADERYAEHIAKARTAGLVTGAYHFNWKELDPVEQARFFVKTAGDVGYLFIDVEGDHAFSKEQTIAFVDEVHRLGRRVGLYHSASGFFDAGQDYDWVAHWGVDAPTRAWDFHQFTSSGSVPGYDGRLDLDHYNGTREQLVAQTKETTAMAAPWMHNHVSEREVAHTWPDGQKDDSHWEDCLWCSVVEWLNDTWKDVPDTLAYAEKLRDASGEPPTGGSNYTDVQRAFNKFGIPITVAPLSFAAFWTALKPGTAAVASGENGNLPAGHRLRRFDTDFTGGHAVYVARMDTTDRVWWCDPLAPDTGYSGEWVTKATLKQWMGTRTGATPRALRTQPAPPPPPAGDDMPTITKYIPGQIATVKVTANVRSAPKIATTTIRVVSGSPETWVITGWVSGDKDPDSGSTDWVCRWYNGKWEYTAKANLSAGPAPAPDSSPYTQAQVDAKVKAATDPLNARIAAMKQKTAAYAVDMADE